MRWLSFVIIGVLLIVAGFMTWKGIRFDRAGEASLALFAWLIGVLALVGAGIIAAIDVLPGHDDTSNVVEEIPSPTRRT
jgi:hypothetical protein